MLLSTSTPPISPAPRIQGPTPQIDPMNSPYPVPWQWVMETFDKVRSTTGAGVRYYRSPSLMSPNGEYAAYSRIEMHVEAQLYECYVSSVMFVEHLATGDLQTIMASSPIATHQIDNPRPYSFPGAIAILIPVSWNSAGNQLLARQFEALFSTSDMSDYAVIWDQQHKQTYTLAPHGRNYEYAMLLGWSQTYPGQVLFRAGNLGQTSWPLWAVSPTGKTVSANQDRPLVFGNTIPKSWEGPQFHWEP